MPWTILFHRQASAALARLDWEQQAQIDGAMQALGRNPWPDGTGNPKPLKGRKHKGLYRLRVGSFRVVYRIIENRIQVLVLVIGQRGAVYQILDQLLGK